VQLEQNLSPVCNLGMCQLDFGDSRQLCHEMGGVRYTTAVSLSCAVHFYSETDPEVPLFDLDGRARGEDHYNICLTQS
jgi:hypothetical protein